MDHEDFVGDDEDAAFLEDADGGVGIVDDEPDDDVIHGVAGGNGVNVYFGGAEGIANAREHAGPVFEEEGELTGNLHG